MTTFVWLTTNLTCAKYTKDTLMTIGTISVPIWKAGISLSFHNFFVKKACEVWPSFVFKFLAHNLQTLLSKDLSTEVVNMGIATA